MPQRYFSHILIGTVLSMSMTTLAQEARRHELLRVEQVKPERFHDVLRHDGKPFFPIGAYGIPRSKDGKGYLPMQTLREAGWNMVQMTITKDRPIEEIQGLLTQANQAGLAVVLDVGAQFVQKQDRENLRQRIQALHSSPGLLGYYIFDEPENFYISSGEFKQYRAGLTKGSDDDILAGFIARKIGWVKPLIRQADPSPAHYIFMCIGWWTDYQKLQMLCDVNMPNEYPTKNTQKEFEGKQSLVTYDARVAASAARKNGQYGFCYTPLGLDNAHRIGSYRSPTLPEFRYSAFAPITQGAMGMIYWAGYRCSYEYTQSVVFPVTRQLSGLTPFFLGQWKDDLLQCRPSDRKTALLKELDLPAVSGCLRQSEDGRYLLLAVNNTPDPLQAEFSLQIRGLPAKARDTITGHVTDIKNGMLTDLLSPYDVVAYIIEPLK